MPKYTVIEISGDLKSIDFDPPRLPTLWDVSRVTSAVYFSKLK